MGDNPEVKIVKLERRPDDSFGPQAELGAQTDDQTIVQIRANRLLQQLAAQAKEIYLLEWEGNTVNPILRQ